MTTKNRKNLYHESIIKPTFNQKIERDHITTFWEQRAAEFFSKRREFRREDKRRRKCGGHDNFRKLV